MGAVGTGLRAGLALLLALALALPAAAQETTRETSVKGRARPDFQPIGLDLGTMLSPLFLGHEFEVLNAFTAKPRMEIEYEYDDNVFNQADGGTADSIYRLKPSLAIVSEWENHALAIDLSGDVGRYMENDQENYEDFRGKASGVINIDTEFDLRPSYTFAKRHEQGSAPVSPVNLDTGIFGPEVAATNAAGGITRFYQTLYELGSTFSTDPIIARIDGAARYSDYIDRGTVDNDPRDLWEVVIVPRLGYQAFEDTSIFVQPRYVARIFDVNRNAAGFDPDSQDYELLVGTTYDLTGLTFAELGVGVVHTRFDDTAFDPATGVSYDGKLIWNATDLLTVTARALRASAATADRATTLITTHSLSLGVDWEADENLLFGAEAGYSFADYDQPRPANLVPGAKFEQRRDDTLTLNLNARYMIGQNFFAGAGYTWIQRNTNQDGAELSKQRILLRAGVHL